MRAPSLEFHEPLHIWRTDQHGTVCVSSLLIAEIKRIVKDSEIMKEDDSRWPQKNKDGRQELEIRLGSDHIQFEVGDLVLAAYTSKVLMGVLLDSKNWVSWRCNRLGRSGRPQSVLLPGAGPQGTGVLADLVAFQGMVYCRLDMIFLLMLSVCRSSQSEAVQIINAMERLMQHFRTCLNDDETHWGRFSLGQ